MISHTCESITTPAEDAVIRSFRQAARSPNTQRAYASAWRQFESWVGARGLRVSAVNDAVVAAYVTHLAQEGCTPSTIESVYSGLLARLRVVVPDYWGPGWRPPLVADVLKGIRHKLARPPVRKRPLTDAELGQIVDGFGDRPKDVRDRALLLLGMCGGFRRSELVALDVDMITASTQGVEILLPRSKTDQEGEGRVVAIVPQKNEKLCPVHALSRWLEAASIDAGPIFRHTNGDRLQPQYVARLVKRCVERIGLDPSHFSGHSLRAGFVTSAARKGKSLDAIMRQTGHRNVAQVMEYIRRATAFEGNASEGLFE
jgi:site-specific recombinase XerD